MNFVWPISVCIYEKPWSNIWYTHEIAAAIIVLWFLVIWNYLNGTIPVLRYKTVNPIQHTHTHTRLTALFSGTTQVSRYQKGKTNLDFSEATDNEWQWHQLGHMQVCTSLQIDNHASTPPLSFLQAGCPSCRPTNSVKALKAKWTLYKCNQICATFTKQNKK